MRTERIDISIRQSSCSFKCNYFFCFI